MNFYNKQHRKLGDSVYYCCQSAEQLDKQSRLLAQQTIVLKNLGKQKKGIFALPAVFCWSAYYQVPKQNDKPMASGVFRLRLDHGLQDCFETDAGVGLAGMKADRGEKKKGLSLLWVIPALVLAGFLMVRVPMRLAKGLSGATMGAAKVAAESYKFGNIITNQAGETPGLFATANPERSKTNSLSRDSGFLAPALRQDLELKTNEIYLTGISTMNGRVVVFLSTGEMFTSEDRELQFVSKRKAIIAGKTYVFAPVRSPAKEGTPVGRLVQPF